VLTFGAGQINEGKTGIIRSKKDGVRDTQHGSTQNLHTVLAIGYDESPRRVYAYDSNLPNMICELRANDEAKKILYSSKGEKFCREFGMIYISAKLS
jgi:hypothetical protein